MNKQPLSKPCEPHTRAQRLALWFFNGPRPKPKLPSRSLGTLTRLPATLLFLLALLSGCVSGSPVLPNPYVPCDHPRVSVATMEGLTQGLLDYADSVDLCNALNGHPLDKDTK